MALGLHLPFILLYISDHQDIFGPVSLSLIVGPKGVVAISSVLTTGREVIATSTTVKSSSQQLNLQQANMITAFTVMDYCFSNTCGNFIITGYISLKLAAISRFFQPVRMSGVRSRYSWQTGRAYMYTIWAKKRTYTMCGLMSPLAGPAVFI